MTDNKPQEGEGAVMLRTIADGLDPEPCPGGCGCRWLEDAEAAECGCDGGCCDEGWDRPERPDDPEDVLYSLNDLRRVLGHPSLSLEHALAAAANRLRTPAAPPAEGARPRHEVECPRCGTTIRARMADAPTVVDPVYLAQERGEAPDRGQVCSECGESVERGRDGVVRVVGTAQTHRHAQPWTPVPR